MYLSTCSYEKERISAVRREAIASSALKVLPERRTAPRVSVLLEAMWEGMSGMREARITDLSLHGCFLESCAQTSVGEQIKFHLKMPTERWLVLNGEVAFYQPMVGFGLRFIDISEQDKAMLYQLIEFYS